jgi:5-methylcytosine-specific restriction endonuclease McrA
MQPEIRLIYSKTDGCCHLCGKKHKLSDYATTWQREHHIPKALGGSDEISNLYVACVECNQLKGTRTSKTVRKWMGLDRIPLSRNAKKKIKEEREQTNLLLLLLGILFFAVALMEMYNHNLKAQHNNNPQA